MAMINIVVAARLPVPGESGMLTPGKVHQVNDVWLMRGRGRPLLHARHIVPVDEYVKGILRDPLSQLQAKAVRRGLSHDGLDLDALRKMLLDGIATYEPAPDPLPPAEEPADDAGDDEEVEDDGEEQDEPEEAGEDKPKPKKRRRR